MTDLLKFLMDKLININILKSSDTGAYPDDLVPVF